MSYLQHLYVISVSMAIMGLMSGRTLAQTNSQALMVTDKTSPLTVSNLREKTGDPADGFTGRGSPSRRSSGGSRGNCSELLVALIPGDETLAVSEAGCNLASSSELALTTAPMPILWFYIPPQSGPIEGELALLDNNQFALSIQTITLPQAGGIVGIQVDTELAVDRAYNWVFSLLENPKKPSNNPRVAGLLQRITPSPDVLLEIDATEDLQVQADIWLKQGIWHNALTTLAHLQRSGGNQTAVEQQWQAFLSASGLDIIADAPIQDCCQ